MVLSGKICVFIETPRIKNKSNDKLHENTENEYQFQHNPASTQRRSHCAAKPAHCCHLSLRPNCHSFTRPFERSLNHISVFLNFQNGLNSAARSLRCSSSPRQFPRNTIVSLVCACPPTTDLQRCLGWPIRASPCGVRACLCVCLSRSRRRYNNNTSNSSARVLSGRNRAVQLRCVRRLRRRASLGACARFRDCTTRSRADPAGYRVASEVRRESRRFLCERSVDGRLSTVRRLHTQQYIAAAS